MGNVKIRYYVTRQAWPGSKQRLGYWAPLLKRKNPKTGESEPTKMAKLGFELEACGPDGPAAWAKAQACNEKWDRARRGEAVDASAPVERVYPPGSLGEAFKRFKKTATWLEGKKSRTREDWERGWKHIEPVFGDVDPKTVTLEDVDLWYGGDPENPEIKGLLQTVGVREAHRAMKIWRALWRVAGAMKTPAGGKYCERNEDPSLGIRRKTPRPRDDIWLEGEAVRLVKRAWRMKFHGLACVMAVAWDTMLSPVDVRSVTPQQLRGDAEGSMFSLDRAKTGRAAIGTFSKRTARLIDAYVARLPAELELHEAAPMFRNRSGAPYTKDTLGDDFRAVRTVEFPDDKRKLMDFRRSGAVEALAGEVDPGALAGKMANSIDRNKALQDTYLPQQATVVRIADAARARGRAKLRGGTEKKGA